jgi:hypothetical protein
MVASPTVMRSPGDDLVDLGEADAAQQPPGSLRGDDARPARHANAATGRRDGRDARARRDGVDVLGHRRVRPRAVAAQVTQARAQQRIGQQARPPSSRSTVA